MTRDAQIPATLVWYRRIPTGELDIDVPQDVSIFMPFLRSKSTEGVLGNVLSNLCAMCTPAA